jgi:hypothetical protein
MPKLALTDMAVRTLATGTYFDTKTPAFGIRIGKHRRTWIVLKGAKSTKLRLGHYPALSLAEARRKALVALGSPYHRPTAPTFPEALDEFLERHGSTLRPRSKREITRTLRRHFHWKKTLDQIMHNDVAAVIDGIEAKSEAAHALKDIRTFFNWCVPKFIPYSPANGIRADYKYIPRERLLTDLEVKKIWDAAAKIGNYGTVIRACITTGQRIG